MSSKLPYRLTQFAVASIASAIVVFSVFPQLDARQNSTTAQLQSLSASVIDDSNLEKQKLYDLYGQYWNFLMHELPEWATQVGFPGQNSRWTDLSSEGFERRLKEEQAFQDTLATIDRSRLSIADQLNYDIIKWDIEWHQIDAEFFDEYMPITHFNGIHLEIPLILEIMPKDTLLQGEDMLSRLRGIPHLLEQARILMDKGLQKGITPPKITLKDVPKQIDNLLTLDPINSALFLPFTQFSENLPETDRLKLMQEAKEILSTQVFPAFRHLYDYLVEEYIPQSRDTTAMADLPNGRAWYASKVRFHTSTNLTPKEIHEIGLKEVARIRSEMQKIIDRVPFKSSFEEFIEFLESNPQFFYDDCKSLLEGYREIVNEVKGQLPLLFGKLPNLPLEVVSVPAYAEEAQVGAYYVSGSIETGRPGYFFANTFNLSVRPKWEMDALALHEALPGHHLQISLALELDTLPEFRKHSSFTAFVEGWGLYAESLGSELGRYLDPYSQFGRFMFEMFRAARLVVDTGLHELGWSRQQAIDYLIANVGMNQHETSREVDRYLVIPGQALAYKIGELKIKELRARAKDVLGVNFNIRTFHDQLLSYGSAIPLDLLEAQINEWLEMMKNEVLTSSIE
jgi:uncharacterized protein (DUF885 family)